MHQSVKHGNQTTGDATAEEQGTVLQQQANSPLENANKVGIENFGKSKISPSRFDKEEELKLNTGRAHFLHHRKSQTKSQAIDI